ncbi:hypothetical protein LMB96_07125 [Limosilactobacillus reuteri]|uniref:hypothetical protein n=1 Tax=Limosilactobacillus reuteri TaxID=1598 RepID=UPI001E53A37F|nr:hypothetical protein [Limosilactobacillus reuteri]MCC4422105.1 hypothetical protein [Limosilactobacillus reuteri]
MKKRIFLIDLAIFIFIYVYLTQISPVVPFDGDDWRYIGAMRIPLPMWGVWNPTRVLPETLMSVGGYIAAFIVYPINKNYVNSLAITEAFIISLFIIIFLYSYYNLLTKRFHFSEKLSIASEVMFFISFFLLFKHLNQPSYTGFWTVDLSCDFFYLIPGLLNASVVMFLESRTTYFFDQENKNNFEKGLAILILYFTLFSNTQLTIILATYCFFKICQKLIDNKWKINFSFFRSISWYACILLVWFGTIIFDLNGERSKNVQATNSSSLADRFNEVLHQLKVFLENQNDIILIICLITIAATYIVYFKMRVKTNNFTKNSLINFLNIILLCFVSSILYLIIVYIKAGSQYVARPDAMWPVIFFMLFAFNISFIFLANYIRLIKVMTPLLLTLSALIAFNFNYHQIYTANVPYSAETSKNVDNYIINQVKKADLEGKETVKVKVPLDQEDASPSVSTSNWPHSYDMATWLQNTLYSHRIIRSRMKIIFEPDKKINKKFYENKNQQQFFPLE